MWNCAMGMRRLQAQRPAGKQVLSWEGESEEYEKHEGGQTEITSMAETPQAVEGCVR